MISPFLNDTTDGVVRLPSGFAIIFDSVPSRTATAEFVVPKSIPMILDICFSPFYFNFYFAFLSFIHSFLSFRTSFQLCYDTRSRNRFYFDDELVRRLGKRHSDCRFLTSCFSNRQNCLVEHALSSG